jgi:hypothetical protein
MNHKKLTSMTKKTFQFVTAIVGGLQTAAVGAVTYFLPENATAINGAIVIIGTAIIEACAQFVKPEQEKE